MLGVVEDRRRVGVAHERGVDDALGSRRLPRKEHFLPNGDVQAPWKFSVVMSERVLACRDTAETATVSIRHQAGRHGWGSTLPSKLPSNAAPSCGASGRQLARTSWDSAVIK